ncbi:MAG: bifunctional transcriptional activator/DNA repair enzyme AdaA, partial [Caulobacteraceae bacterium]
MNTQTAAETATRPAPIASNPAERDPRWPLVVARDASADGDFFYSVETTGVYCRPSCPSRAANPRNVRFHDSAAACEAAGFRPCKRCRPDQASPAARNAEVAAAACRAIDEAEETPTLARLAKAAGLSPFHFHRLFKAATGVTPKAYAVARRAAKVRDGLTSSSTVTQAIYDAGFNSNGRFYETSKAFLGMTPTALRAGGARETIRFAIGRCSLGDILVAASDKGVCAILFGDEPDDLARELQDRFPNAGLIGGDAGFERLVAQ